MVKGDLINTIAESTGLSKKEAKQAVGVFFDSISQSLNKGEGVELRGFGSFRVKDRKARTGRNPSTGEAISIPAKKVAVFKPGKELKDKV